MSASKQIFYRITAIFLALVIAGCGQNGARTIPSGTALASSQAEIQIALTVPKGATTSSSSRRTQYLSTQTASIAFTITPDGQPGLSPTIMNVSSCKTLVIGVSCTTTLPAVIGGDTLLVSAYAGINGTGNLLSTGSTHMSVVAGTANSATLTLSGVVHSIALSVNQPAPFAGTPSTINLFVTAIDAAGETITGSFEEPITLINSDTSGVTSLSSVTLSASAASVAVLYSGGSANATISASAAGVGNSAVTPATIISRAAGQYLYVALTSPTSGTGEVEEFPLSASGNIAPSWTLSDPVGMAYPQAIAGDSSHRLYVFNNGYFTTVDAAVYPAGAAGSSVTPIKTLNASPWTFPTGFAADNNGGLYVATGGSNSGGNDIYGSVSYFDPTQFSASLTPLTVIPRYEYGSSALSQDGQVSNIAVDSTGRLIYVPGASYGYFTLPPVSAQSSVPLASLAQTLSGGAQGLIGINADYALAIGANDAVYVGARVGSHAAILWLSALANGTTYSFPSPLTDLSGSSTHLDDGPLFGLAVSQDGRVFVAIQIQTTSPESYEILVFPPGSTGNVAPIQTIYGANAKFDGSYTFRTMAVF